MRITVKIDDKCIVVPCPDEKLPIKWLISEALKRNLPPNSKFEDNHDDTSCVAHYVLCLPNGGVLWSEDGITNVLENDEFVELKSKIFLDF